MRVFDPNPTVLSLFGSKIAVASYADAWIEITSVNVTADARDSRILRGCVD